MAEPRGHTWYRSDNPCKGIRKNSETRRERYLGPPEIKRLMDALTASTHQRSSADAVMLLLLTGARRNEVLGAEWSEFDLANGWWLKPAGRTKSKKQHRVALSPGWPLNPPSSGRPPEVPTT